MKTIIAFLGILFFLTACNPKDDSLGPQDGVIVQDNLIIIKDESKYTLKSIAGDKMIFSESDINAKNFKIGSVLAGGPSEKSPYGYLKKVTSVNKKSGEVELKTEQATITDAIKQCDVEYYLPLDFEMKDIKLGDGVVIESVRKGRISAERTQFLFSHFIDIDGYAGDGSINCNIKLDVPEVKIQLKIEDSKVQKFGVTILGDYNIGVNLKASTGVSLKKDYSIINIPIGKIPCNIGIIPFYMEASIQATLKPELKIGGKLEYGTIYTYKLDSGVLYENGAWKNINNSKEDIFAPSIKLGSEFSAKVELDLKPVFQPYGIDGFEISFGFRPGIEAKPELTPERVNILIDFILSIFTNIGVDFDIKLLNIKFKSEFERAIVFPPKRIITIPLSWPSPQFDITLDRVIKTTSVNEKTGKTLNRVQFKVNGYEGIEITGYGFAIFKDENLKDRVNIYGTQGSLLGFPRVPVPFEFYFDTTFDNDPSINKYYLQVEVSNKAGTIKKVVTISF